MRSEVSRILVIAASSLWLAACTTDGNSVLTTNDMKTPGADAYASAAPSPGEALTPSLLGSDPTDDVSLGKKQYHVQNYGRAERYFRHAVEQHPRDAEAWLGL